MKKEINIKRYKNGTIEIVKKAFSAGLRSIISRSAPTCAAIKSAKQVNLGIIGFLRGNRFNIYTLET